MKRVFGALLLLALFATPSFAAKNTERFTLLSDVRVGENVLPKGTIDVTWADASAAQTDLTIKLKDKKTVTITVKVVPGNSPYSGALTSDKDGVKILRGFQTKVATFLVEGAQAGK
jgi:hypothetical protein